MGGGDNILGSKVCYGDGVVGYFSGGEVVLGIKGVINPAPPPPISVREGKNKLF